MGTRAKSQPRQRRGSVATEDTSLRDRYLTEQPKPSDLTFGKPFRFGTPLTFTRHRIAENDTGRLWQNISYLDPALLWLPFSTILSKQSRAPLPQVQAAVVSHKRAGGDQEQLPPPASVTVTKAPVSGVSGVDLHPKTSGLAVRETLARSASTGATTAMDGSFPVYERLDKQEAKRRALAAAGAGGLLSMLAAVPPSQRPLVQSSLSALQRVVQAWAEEEQLEGVTPAPGDYEADKQSSRPAQSSGAMGGPCFTMGRRTQAAAAGQSLVSKDAALLPGPGQYNVADADKNTGPAYTLPGRPRDPPPPSVPGPGQYQAEPSSIGTGPAYTILGRTAEKTEELPGPGDYDLDRSINTGTAFSMAGKPREATPDRLPGPADYQRLEPAGKGAPAFSLHGRLEGPRPDADIPAPGEYELPAAWRTGPAVTMGTRPVEQKRDVSPGPGEYMATRISLDGPSYTIASRPPPPAAPDHPGPGDYEPYPESTTLQAPAFSMAPRPGRDRMELETAMLPGPGQYCPGPDPRSPRAPSYTIGTRPIDNPDPQGLPGPGAYDVPADPKGPGPAFTIRTRPAPECPPDSPGPAQYSPTHIRPRAPQYTMGTLLREPPDQDNPAPGDYEVRSSLAGPAYTIPAAGTLPPRSPPSSPGPGEYQLRPSIPSGPAYTIPATGRAQEQEAEESPGPGDYQSLGRAGEGAPAYTIPGRHPESPRPASPGPGEYHRELPTEGPSFTLRGKPPEPVDQPTVGPGEYHPRDPALPAAPAYTIARRLEDKSDQQDVPGPGAYRDPPSPRGPAYTMRGRPQEPRSQSPDSPGPGAHEVPLHTLDGPAYTMRARPKDGRTDEYPGPGEYASPRGDPGPAFTMRAKPAERSPPPSPGPGDYQSPRAPAGPAFTMAGRHQELTVLGDDVIIDPDIPGPGTYGAPGQDLIGRGGPAYTMRPRTRSVMDAESGGDSPGPAAYPAPASPNGPAFTMAPHYPPPGSPRAGQGGPGPGEYGAPMPPDRDLGPAFTMYERWAPAAKGDSPGPGEYAGDTAGQGMAPQGPAFTMGPRVSSHDPALHQQGPGPGEHQRVLHPPTGPAFTLGQRLRDLLGLKKKQAPLSEVPPEPGQYYNPPGPSGPAYTFSPRFPSSQPSQTPAPGDHHPELDFRTGPAYTLQKKATSPRPPMVPGPGTYSHPQRPPLSSILQSRPMGRAQYQVQRFDYPDLTTGPLPAAAVRGGRQAAPGGGAPAPGLLADRLLKGTIPASARVPGSDVHGADQASMRPVGSKSSIGEVAGRRHADKQAVKGPTRSASAPRVTHYITQPATSKYVYRPLPEEASQPRRGVRLAQPAPTITGPAAGQLVPKPDPRVVGAQSGAAGKPALGIVKRGPRKIAPPAAVVTLTDRARSSAAAPQSGAGHAQRVQQLSQQYMRLGSAAAH